MKKIIIRTLGGKGIGYGHFYRCLSLAKAIKMLGTQIHINFIINDELVDLIYSSGFDYIVANDLTEDIATLNNINPSLFIFDSYLGTNEYLRNIKEKTKLMLIDDNNDIYDSVIPDIIYNGNIFAEKLVYSETEEQLRLLGPEYLIMKEEYWDNKDNSIPKEGILITTGGTDEHEIAIKLLEAIKGLDIKVKVIIGPGYRDEYIKQIEELKIENVELIYKPSSLKSYISSSKIVVTAGGSTIYEVLSQRSIPVVFSIADNQDLACKTLSHLGVEYMGKYPNIDYSRLAKTIETIEVINAEDKYSSIFKLVNNNGAKLVAKTVLKNI
ncbi:putative protein MJ1062 [Proteiniborus sp. DW1]|uniref:glycosyltransferase n=1 Tax=Proteiniborus sp. DW1 TaxID=1889883 RepID=UPI00092E1D60|nr:glycosyltransferase [Proteiniborus sp. DW1]SCG81938.1 putative protein MJ1062 [Proteiniborus sp. DW1]